jgi:hypothetical protein
MPRLENWSVISYASSPYQAPELGTPVLYGEVFGHPRFDDGHRVHTSFIVGKRGDNVQTNNTLYELGEIDPKWEEMFPNARERFLGSLKEVVDNA